MPDSPTDICNDAIHVIEDKSIEDINEETPLGRIVKSAYNRGVRPLLEAYNWSFAIQFMRLSESTNKPLFDFKYAFNLPGNFIKLLDVKYKDVNQTRVGKFIYSMYKECAIAYIANVTDCNLFSPLFREALVLDVASKIAVPRKQNLNIASGLKDQSRQLIKEAIANDQDNDYSIEFLTSHQIEARLIESVYIPFDKDIREKI